MGFSAFLVKPLLSEATHEVATVAARDAERVAVEAESRGARSVASGATRSSGKEVAESVVRSSATESVSKTFVRSAARQTGKYAVTGAAVAGGAYYIDQQFAHSFHGIKLPHIDFPDFTKLPHVVAQFLDKVNPVKFLHNVESGLHTGFTVVMVAGGAYLVYLIFK